MGPVNCFLRTCMSGGISGYFNNYLLLSLGDQVICRGILRCPSTAHPSLAQPYLPGSPLEDRCTLAWGHTSRTPWEATDPRVGSTDLKVRHGRLLKVGTELREYERPLSVVTSCLLINCFHLSPNAWVMQNSTLLMGWKELYFVYHVEIHELCCFQCKL